MEEAAAAARPNKGATAAKTLRKERDIKLAKKIEAKILPSTSSSCASPSSSSSFSDSSDSDVSPKKTKSDR